MKFHLLKNTIWCLLIATLLFMVAGHSGDHSLDWVSMQISTYAAKAPYDYLVTTSILLAALTLLLLGLLVTRYEVLGSGAMAHLVAPLAGAAGSGLCMLAYFEETVPTLHGLKQAGFMAIRIQSFHDAGLTIFFYSMIIFLVVTGVLIAIQQKKLSGRLAGLLIMVAGPLAYVLMTGNWPALAGYTTGTIGLKQRAGLLCLWLGVFIFMLLIRRIKNLHTVRP